MGAERRRAGVRRGRAGRVPPGNLAAADDSQHRGAGRVRPSGAPRGPVAAGADASPRPRCRVQVPSACGAVRVEKDPPRLLADLGPAERLTVRWQEGAASAMAGPGLNAEQLVWLKVQPGSLVITTKFKLHVGEGQIQQVQLAVDPRLRLLPLPGDDPPTVQVGPESEQARLHRLPLVASRLGAGHAGSHVPARRRHGRGQFPPAADRAVGRPDRQTLDGH